MGYHSRQIVKGVIGETSKIREELEELIDFEQQDPPCTLGMLIELSDLIGAIDAYLKKHHPTVSLADLIVMSNRTAMAFADGSRK